MEEILYQALVTTGYDVYPQFSPQNHINPVIVYNVTASDEYNGINCYGNTQNVRFQVDCYNKSYSDLKTMKQKVYEAIRLIPKDKAYPIIFGFIDSADENERRCKIDLKLIL